MKIAPCDYYTEDDWSKFYDEASKHATPFLLISPKIITRNYQKLRTLFPYADVYYAVKANPGDEVLTLLRDLGSNFDIASIYELDQLLRLNISPDRISYGNTIKKAADIRYAWEHGVRLFATDSLADVENIATYAKGSSVFFRILSEGGSTAEWPLSRKFGCNESMVVKEILLARDRGLHPVGISFHVGSQQRDIGAWGSALTKVHYIFEQLNEYGISLDLVNMGGGLPAKYTMTTNPLETYAAEISRNLKETFGPKLPRIIVEPGRSLVASSGVLVSEVVMISKKTIQGIDRWLYIDAGKFNGLIETLDENIIYPVYSDAKGENVKDFIVAGPTCDSVDILYETYRVPLPSEIAPGDRLYWLTTGAYTSSYSSIGFNGFPPLPTYYVH